MPFSYDEVVYPGLPYGQTHPSRLASLATLFGMDPAPVERCRVLEIACGSGGNLIPMAFELENSEFLGIDLAETAIAQGRLEIAELGLGNVRLEHMDVMDAGPALGTFDYIIAHGFYSWVPAPAREKLLEVVRECLRPQGVAYVSYNALPGCRIRELLRETMLFHARDETDPEARLAKGRQMLQWFTESYCAPGISRGFLKDEAQSMLDRGPQFLYHDEMSEVFYPVYFQDFMARAASFGLQYISEANYFDTQPGKIPEAIAAEVRRIAGCDRILLEQYYDLLKCRMFRQTLLCHSGAAAAAPVPARISRLHAASAATPVSAQPDFGDTPEEFVGPRGSSAKTAHRLAKAALFTLGQAWPEGLPFADLLTSSSRLAEEEESPESLAEILMATYTAGMIELRAHAVRCTARVCDRPKAGALARSQAARGKLITTALHGTIECGDEVERRLIALMDGTRDFPALVRDLTPVSGRSEEAVAEAIRANVAALAKAGVLVE